MRLPLLHYLQVTLEQGVVPGSSPRAHEVPGWPPAGDTLSHGWGDSLALIGSSPRDGVSIKIPLVVLP